MKTILDTSFILTCLKEKIDFLNAREFGKLILSKQVLEELSKISEQGNLKEKDLSKLALDIISKNKPNFEIIDFSKKYVDAGILDYAKNNQGIIIATLDSKLKKKLKGKAKILGIRGKVIDFL